MTKEIKSTQEELSNSTRLIIKGVIDEEDARPIISGIKQRINEISNFSPFDAKIGFPHFFLASKEPLFYRMGL